jgi:YjbR
MNALLKLALRYPEAQEGIACEGTAAEKRTAKARNKAFLFVGPANAMVKLRESLAEAAELALKEPDRYKVGALGWVTVTFGRDGSPPLDVLERWIDESYRLLMPRQLVALLPQRGLPTGDGTETVQTKTSKKNAKPKGSSG